MNYSLKEMDSPVGRLRLIATEDALVALLWQNQTMDVVRGEKVQEVEQHLILDRAERQLNEYFAGKRRTFEFPLNPAGTSFQRKVWKALCEIPFGTTETYGRLAKIIGAPNASRAVGAATGKNPIGIMIPCHRVIGANGKLTGFAGGLGVKDRLLKLERSAQV